MGAPPTRGRWPRVSLAPGAGLDSDRVPQPLEQKKPRQDALGNKIPDPAEELAIAERELHELKVAFEHYFLGMERKAPLRKRETLGEKIRRYRTHATAFKAAGHKFRLEQLASKFAAYERIWTRTLTEIESGTYKRDVFKMRRRVKPATESTPAKATSAADSQPQPQAEARARPEAANPLSDGQIRAIYDAFVLARRRTGEPTEGLSVEVVAATLRKQAPEILRRYECQAVEFKVVIKEGRALLRALPRK